MTRGQIEGDVAVIGFGVMGEALARSLMEKRLISPESTRVSEVDPDRARLAEDLGFSIAPESAAAARGARLILLCVKPQVMPQVLADLAGSLGDGQTVISIAAGITTGLIEESLESPVPVVRAMPNLPSTVGEGVIALAPGRYAGSETLALAQRVFHSSGRVFVVDESMMDAVTGFTGSGPAFIAVVLEALSDAGVRVGFSRQEATAMAAQVILGSARLILQTGTHPAALKDQVASPGGTAIAGLHRLESSGIRAGIMDAVLAATERSAQLGQAEIKPPVAPGPLSTDMARAAGKRPG